MERKRYTQEKFQKLYQTIRKRMWENMDDLDKIRPISLLNIDYKIFMKIIANRKENLIIKKLQF